MTYKFRIRSAKCGNIIAIYFLPFRSAGDFIKRVKVKARIEVEAGQQGEQTCYPISEIQGAFSPDHTGSSEVENQDGQY